jgi:hypothetical protein
MKYATIEDVMASFPHSVLPTVQGEPDYQTIHATRKFLQANLQAIDTHLGGGTLGHLGLIISDASYAMISPTTDAGPIIWISPQAPGRAPDNTDGTAAHISAAFHVWAEGVQTYRTYTSVQQALKKQIISVFEPMYLDVLNDNMVGFANISARDMLDHLFSTYGNITVIIWKSTLNTCAEHGIPNNQLNPCSSRFKIVQIILRQAASLLDTRSKSMLATPPYLQLDNSRAPAAGGMKSRSLRKLGHNSNLTLLPLNVSTSKSRANLPQQPGTTQRTPLLDKLKTNCMKPPLEH